MSRGLLLYVDFVVFVFGAVVGSFLNVCVHRMPRAQSIVLPPSHCPHCNELIRWYDNIPLVSYLVLRGRCRHCKAPITSRYFLVELLTAVLFLSVYLRFGGHWTTPAYCLLIGGLIAATFIDFEHYIIPNEITIGGVVAGLIVSAAAPALHRTASHLDAVLQSVLGIVAGGACLLIIVEVGKLLLGKLKIPLPPGSQIEILEEKFKFGDEEITWDELFARASDRVRFHAASLKFQDQTFDNVDVRVSDHALEIGDSEYELAQIGRVEATTDQLIIPREAMGMGDVKLLAGIGAFVGWQATLFIVFVSSVIGGVTGMLLVFLGKKDLQSRIPYGPYISLAALLWIFCGREMIQGYMNFMDWLINTLLHSPRG